MARPDDALELKLEFDIRRVVPGKISPANHVRQPVPEKSGTPETLKR